MREHPAWAYGGCKSKPWTTEGPLGIADVDHTVVCGGRGRERLTLAYPGWYSLEESGQFLSLLQGANETTAALESLVEAGAGLNAGLSVGPFGAVVAVTPLFTACEDGHLPSVEALVAL